MEKTERIKCILNGETPDRLAYGFWTHFPKADLDARALAETSYAFYRDLDLDFIKSMPNGLFSIQERLKHVGGRLEISSDPGKGTRIILILPLQTLKKDRS